jgi:hypothetical protein
MAKESGLGMTSLNVDDNSGSPQDIKNDVTNFQFASPRAVQDTTGVDKFAMERLLLLADFSITLNGVFNDASNASHDVFKTIPSSAAVSRTVALVQSGQTMTAECLLTDYPLTRGQDGSLTWAVPGVLSNGTAPAWT